MGMNQFELKDWNTLQNVIEGQLRCSTRRRQATKRAARLYPNCPYVDVFDLW